MQIHEPKPLGYDSRLQLFSAFFLLGYSSFIFFYQRKRQLRGIKMSYKIQDLPAAKKLEKMLK
jgi:hypothetical protein